MSWLLVSVSRVRAALRMDSGESDALIEFYISAASRAVVRYLKGQAGDLLSIDSPPNSPPADIESDVPEDVAMATIALVGILYRQPDGDDAKNFSDTGQLPYIVTALLYPLRDPALA